MTIQEVSQRIGKSESTIRRMIKAGTITASMVDGKYDIAEESVTAFLLPIQLPSQAELITRLRDEIEYLRKELSDSREQSNMIIMQMTRQMESLQPPPRRSFWDRFKRK